MKKPTEHYAKDLDDALKCYYSDQGCFKIPVRMVMEKPDISSQVLGSPVEVEGVLLCRDHAATYVVKDALADQQIVSDEILKQFEEWGV